MISGEEESRLAYLGVQSGLDLGNGSLVVFDTGGGSSQFTFGRRRAGRRALQRRRRRRALHRALRARRRRVPEVLAQALDAIAADLSRIDGRPKPDRLVGMGGAVTNITAVKHRLTTYDPTSIQGSMLDTGRDRPADRALPLEGRRGAAHDRRPPTQARRRHPGRRLHRADGHGEARPEPAHGERPRPPPRRARRTIRNGRRAKPRRFRPRKTPDDHEPTRQGDGAAAIGRGHEDARHLSSGCRTRRWRRSMALIKDVDSVELKLTVPATNHRATDQRARHSTRSSASRARCSSSTRRSST